MPAGMCSSSGQIFFVAVFRPDYIWISCCRVLGRRDMDGGQWDTGVAKQLYLMALVISEPTQVTTSLVPFCPSLWKLSWRSPALIPILLVSTWLVKIARWDWRWWRAFCIHSHPFSHSVLLPSNLFCTKSLAALGSGREQVNMVIENASNSRWQEEFLWNSHEQLLLLVGFYY